MRRGAGRGLMLSGVMSRSPHPLSIPLLLVAPVAWGLLAGVGPAAPANAAGSSLAGATWSPVEGPAEDPAEDPAARVAGPLAEEGAALHGAAGEVSFARLDDVLIWRDGRSPNGKQALGQLLELRVLAAMARAAGLEISDEALRARFDELDAMARQGGAEDGLAADIAARGIAPEEFREYLRLAMIHEALTREALGLPKDAPLTADQQQLWLESALRERGVTETAHPWADGVVCVSGDVTITRADFGAHLRNQIDAEDQRNALYLILLERAVRSRMPEVTAEGLESALDREIERRAAEALADPNYQGASYEQLLDARGLSIEAIRRDPAIRAAALAHEAVDRAHDDESLKAVYAAERAYFDGLFGESVEVRVCFRNASPREDDPLRPSFTKVEAEMAEMLAAIEAPADFARVIEIHSEDRTTREAGGLVGRFTRGTPGVPEALREATFAELDRTGGTLAPGGVLIGPIRLENGVLLAQLSNRLPSPTWETMSQHVHRELRRRFLEESLSRDSVITYLDSK